MTETELLAKVTSEGWTIIETKTLGPEGTGDNVLTIIALLTVKPEGGMMLRRWLNYYKKLDGSCFWRENNPFPTVSTSFGDEVRTKIASLVTAGTIKAGYVEKMDDSSQTALVVAIKSDSTASMYHVYKVGGVLNIAAVTGTYPIG